MKFLLVGDMHAVQSELEECNKLIDYIHKTALEQKVDYIAFMGDQYNYHNIVHLPVVDFWKKAFEKLTGIDTVALVGNHDQANSKDPATPNAMVIHKGDIFLVEGPYYMENILWLPYMASNEDFIRICNEHPEYSTVVCHQTFTGAKYENGFYAPDGVDQDKIPQKNVISGHIHSQQTIGKVWYVGSPRWRSLSDANQSKYIWLVEFNENGEIINKNGFDTNVVCKPIFALEDRPDKPAIIPTNDGHIVIDIFGPPDYVKSKSVEFKEKGFRIRTHPQETIIKIKESSGIKQAFNTYFNEFKPKNGTNKELLLKTTIERLDIFNG